MHALIAKALPVWLLLSSMSGWCCHMPVACNGDASLTISLHSGNGVPGCCCGRCAEAPLCRFVAETSCSCESGCHDACTYITTSRVGTERTDAVAIGDALLDVGLTGPSALSRAFGEYRTTVLAYTPHVRLHALHQIFLI